MKTTVKKLEQVTGAKKAACYGFLCFLEEQGIAQRVGVEHDPGKRGKGTTIYELPDSPVSLADLCSKAVEKVEPCARCNDDDCEESAYAAIAPT